ncbi:hypothetical protein GCM10010365_12250 [Streptomyces poonensis]|uniref:Uncharacterized protein n=1 Tax=Streptomyces poonensis TaxID=68255 RepID=A0A918PAX9_9ACTN|nr:hypothetical protein GCM10010365_12250 [Streptomyces poonensis]GLJ88756.1 hypothetical protein GCM10017589_13560 [Streptomyces poonensis]
MTGIFTWIRERSAQLRERPDASEREPDRLPDDGPEPEDTEAAPPAQHGPPPLTGRRTTWLDLIRDVLYSDQAFDHLSKAAPWLVLFAVLVVQGLLWALHFVMRVIDPGTAPSVGQLLARTVAFSLLVGSVWLGKRVIRRLTARSRPGAPAAPEPTANDPVNRTDPPEAETPGPRSGEPQP